MKNLKTINSTMIFNETSKNLILEEDGYKEKYSLKTKEDFEIWVDEYKSDLEFYHHRGCTIDEEEFFNNCLETY